MEPALDFARVNLAPEGTVERTPFEGLLQARRRGVQPRTSTEESAAIINQEDVGVARIVSHQPQQNSLVIAFPATDARSYRGLLGWQRPKPLPF